jgi:hypothetical protein
MAITNLSTQHISASYQYLAQISSSGNIYDGLGNQINQINVINSSYVTAQTASYVNTLRQNVTVTGSVIVSGSLTITGSNTLIGTKTITGSVYITGSKTVIGTNTITGSLFVSGSQNFIGTKTLSGSIFITGSKFIVGDNYITGSHNVSGSMTLTGPSIQNSAPLMSTLVSGSMEFDGSTFYRTVDSSGRTLNANHHLFYLPTLITHTVTTIIDAFSGSLNAFTMQPASLYEVQYNVFWAKQAGTAGNTTWTINSMDQSWQNINTSIEHSAIAGTGTGYNVVTVSPTLNLLHGNVFGLVNQQSVSFVIATATANTNHKATIKALIWTNASQPSRLRLQVTSAGQGAFIYPGSYYTIKKMPVSSVGVFTAST